MNSHNTIPFRRNYFGNDIQAKLNGKLLINDYLKHLNMFGVIGILYMKTSELFELRMHLAQHKISHDVSVPKNLLWLDTLEPAIIKQLEKEKVTSLKVA
jgi:hypothetical protein